MHADALYVLAVLAVTVVLFVTERLRLDVTALLMVLALVLGGQITASEAAAGFGDPVVVLIASLFVVGEGLFRTGVAHRVGGWLLRHGGAAEARLIGLTMGAVALLSAFMSSTGAVAVFVPIALSLAQRTGISRRKLLMPLAIGAMIGGMLTLIGTPPNLVMAAALSRAGLEPFTFFAFTPIGGLVLAVAVAYVVLVAARLQLQGAGRDGGLGPSQPTVRDLLQAHALSGQLYRAVVPATSPLAGRTIAEARPFHRHGVTIAAVRRGGGTTLTATGDVVVAPGDTLFLTGDEAALARFVQTMRLEARAADDPAEPGVGLAEVIVSPLSTAVGRTVPDAGFGPGLGLTVLSVLRAGRRPLPPDETLVLAGGDTLLVSGPWAAIRRLEADRRNLCVLRMPAEATAVVPAPDRAPQALLIMAAMMAILALDLVPSVVAGLAAALAMVLAGCVDMDRAYRAINWSSVVLLAAMLPMGTALDGSGALQVIVDGLVGALAGGGPLLVLAAFFLLTSLLSQVISNTATTVLVAPVALASADLLGASPYPVLMTVAIAASTAFATPVASPINMLVFGPGGYRFVDFVKVGVPLQLLAMVVCLVAVPLLFPF